METGRHGAASAVALAGTVALALTLAACGDGGPTAPDTPQNTDGDGPVAGSVEAAVTVGPREEGQQSVAVRITGKELTVGAYQGRLRFDASVLSLDRVLKGEGGDGSGEFHVLNAQGADRGELRFAAYAVESFADPVALELVFETARSVQASDLEVTMEVVGTAEGRPVPKARTSVREVLR